MVDRNGGGNDVSDEPDTRMCECGNCEWIGPMNELGCQLDQIPDFFERVDVGEICPAGECPKCGALAHLVELPEARMSSEPFTAKNIDPEALKWLREAEAKGMTATEIVEAARDPLHPLHPYFEWDDRVAATNYRSGRHAEPKKPTRN
jgi:hypothetical protein